MTMQSCVVGHSTLLRWFIVRLVIFMGFAATVDGLCLAQEPAPKEEVAEQLVDRDQVTTDESGNLKQDQPSAEVSVDVDASPTVVLSKSQYAGRSIRPIGVYQSQLVDLVPDDFQPVTLSELQTTLDAGGETSDTDNQSYIVSSFYDVRLIDDLLVSDYSSLVIENAKSTTAERSLGRVNLAVRPVSRSVPDSLTGEADAENLASLPRLAVNDAGMLLAMVAGTDSNSDFPKRSELSYGWTLRGDRAGQAVRFDLRLPRSPQTRMVISTSSEIELESVQGVLSRSPGPPANADVDTRSGKIHWYVLEAGGLGRVELIARRSQQKEGDGAIIVRRESKQYEVDLAGVTWTHRLTFELPEFRESIRMRSALGTVSSVRVSPAGAEHQVFPRTDGQSIIDIRLPEMSVRASQANVVSRNGVPSRGAAGNLVTLTISGHCDWSLEDGICDLPSAVFAESNVIWAEPLTQADITILKPLDVAKWELPSGWRQAIQTPNRDDELFLVAHGPPRLGARMLDAMSAGTVGAKRGTTADPESWSRLRLMTQPVLSFEEAWVKLELDDVSSKAIRGKCRLRCRRQRPQIVPIEIQIEPSWTIEKVQVVGSGRQITPGSNSRKMTIWPTASEAASPMIEIDFWGTKKLSRTIGRIPAMHRSMVQPHDPVKSQTVSIVPPKLRRWDGESVMLQGRLKTSDLSSDAVEFFKPLSKALLLRRPFGEVPEVTVEPIDISMAVSLRHEIGREDGFATEKVVLRTQTTQPLPSLLLMAGKSDFGQAPFRWSLRSIDQTATVILSESSVTFDEEGGQGKYKIDLENRDLRDFELVGKRQVPFDGSAPYTVSLPIVANAASQSAECIVSSGWTLDSLPPSVQRVPGRASPDGEQEQPKETRESHGRRLRYDSESPIELTLLPSKSDAATCLVWDQTLEVVAGSRAEDSFRLIANVSSDKPILVSTDSELRLDHCSLNGLECQVESVGDGHYLLEPAGQSDSLIMVFRRFHRNTDWFRLCNVPQVAIEGEVLRQSVVVQADVGSIIFGRRTGNQVFLVPRHAALGLGWLVAATVFLMGWSVSRWFLFGTHLVFLTSVLAVSAAVIWWQWQLPILFWVALPLILSALLQCVIRFQNAAGSPGSGSDETQTRTNLSDGVPNDPSVDFSLNAPLTVVFWLVSMTLFQASPVWAQAMPRESNATKTLSENGSALTPRSTIDLLVPMSDLGQPVGDKVYLSRRDYRFLTDTADPNRPVRPLFESADYRVELTEGRDAIDRSVVQVAIQADFQIRLTRDSVLPGQGALVRLPFRPETLRRVELLGGEQSRIIRTTVDENGVVFLPLPPGKVFRLRVTFSPDVRRRGVVSLEGDSEPVGAVSASSAGNSNTETLVPKNPLTDGGEELDPITDIRLAIPKIHNARLLVESSREVQVDSVQSSLGRVSNRVELGRYEADLGPADELMIQCQPARRSSAQRPSTLQRSYRISAGLTTTTIECEIVPPPGLSDGDVFQLSVMGPRPAIATGPGWQIERVDLIGSETQPADNAVVESGGAYRVTKLSESRSPVRFIWQLPSLLNNPTSPADSEPMTIPEVRGVGVARQTSTVFAVESADQIRMTELTNDAIPIAIDEFLKSWTGYRGSIELAFRTEKEFPNLVLFRKKVAPPDLTLRHDLHVDGLSMVLSLRAELVDGRPTVNRTVWKLPAGFQLLSCRVNGNDNSDWRLLAGIGDGTSRPPQMEIAISDQRVDDRMLVEISGRIKRPVRGTVELPQIVPSVEGMTNQIYRITRDRDSIVQVIEREKQSGAPMASRWKPVPIQKVDLERGWVPVSEFRWFSSQTSSDLVKDRLRLAPKRNGGFPCNQTLVMRYADGRWFCDCLFEIPRSRCPDFVDLQMPTRWMSNVNVTGGESWDAGSSADSDTSVIRVSRDLDQDGEVVGGDAIFQFVVSATLESNDQVRISVPKIKVLGDGSRSISVAVPGQLTTEPIKWRGRGVSTVGLDDDWFVFAEDRISDPGIYSFYGVANRKWSIDLEPLSRASVDPAATISDTRVFLGGEDVLVWQRFDLFPETLESVGIRFPSKAKCIGVWAAGREVPLEKLSDSQNDASGTNDTAGTLVNEGTATEIPLTFDRLAQSIEVLFRLPYQGGRLESYEAILDDVEVESRWCAYYQHKFDSNQYLVIHDGKEWVSDESDQKRWRTALAKSVTTTMERSSDMLAERGAEEVAFWLSPWVARYRDVAVTDAVGVADGELTEDGIAKSNASVKKLADRFLGNGESVPSRLFSQKRWSKYRLLSVIELEGNGGMQPSIRQEASGSSLLRDLLIKGLTLMMVVFALVSLWPFRGRASEAMIHPAVWLGLLGFVCMMVAPHPIGIILVLISIALPAVRFLRWKPLSLDSSQHSSRSRAR